ncbi:MAG TPA: transglycosylase SLT domain-containing protein [Pyrinomonadaceae bacterium]|nr:transglycosylase SLT domain-containing protein [Pyrinomonadaceae bacterium]
MSIRSFFEHRLILIVTLTFISWAVSHGQAAFENIGQKTVAKYDAGQREEAVADLLQLKAQDPNIFAINNYDYLTARLAERSGKTSLAVENYSSVISRNSILKAYALFHLSQCFRSMGNLMMERIYLERILTESPGSLLTSVARSRLARSSYESESFGAVISQLLGNTARSVSVDNSPRGVGYWRDDQVLLGEVRMRQARTSEARTIFADIVASSPNADQPDDAARAAVRGLDILDGFVVGGSIAFAEPEHLSRAKVYQFNRDFRSAKAHFEAVAGRASSPEVASDTLFQIARGYSQSSDHAEALKWYERILEQYPETKLAKDALLQAAAAYARVGKVRESITRYQRFIDKYPTDEKLDRAYLNVVDVLRDQGDINEALKWTAKAREVFAGRLPGTIALFAEAKIHISRAEWQQAFEKLETLRSQPDLGGKTIPGGTDQTEVSFLRCRTLEELKRTDEAVDCYLSIPDGRDAYYGWRATERLALFSLKDETRPAILARTARALAAIKSKNVDEKRRAAIDLMRLSNDKEARRLAVEAYLASSKQTLPQLRSSLPKARPHLSVASTEARDGAVELLFLGLFDEAYLQFAASPTTSNRDELTAVAALGGRADSLIAAAEPLWQKVPADVPIEAISREQLRMLYPVTDRDDLTQFGLRHNVDPRLLLAIMRQESRFRTDARSNAAARGLMQFIAPTANKIASSLGREGFKQEELYSPKTAIEFGSRYLEDLFKLFPEQPQAVVASYNGGEDNLKRWVARSGGNDADLYVSEIVFTQTKDYVYRVMANYRMYKYLYDDRLAVVE